MNQFIHTEETSAKQQIVRTLLRFVWDLRLLKWMFLPSVVFILLCSAIPQYFLWFTGKLVNHLNGTSAVNRVDYHLGGFDFFVPLDLRFLLYLVVAGLLARLISWTLFELSGKWSSQDVHARMMKSVAKTRTTFFDENPSGRLINRMVGDFINLDWAIILVGDTINSFADILCMSILVFIANPLPALGVIPMVIVYLLFQAQLAPMLGHGRELRSIAMGEVLHRETDLIEGREVFARYGQQNSLLQRLHRAYLKTVDIGLMMAKIQWWGELWMGMITVSFSVLVYLFLLIGIQNGSIDPVFAAIVITAILGLADMFGFLTWNLTHMGESAANVRRIYHFVDLPAEQQQEHQDPARRKKTYRSLQPTGDIRFDRFHMSYRPDTPLILEDLCLTLPAAKKIGVVGKTGCGKTSVLQSLFRMVHVHAGDITIGGVSIYELEIDALRSLFGVVPQDPYLFAGTVRYNLSGGNPGISDSGMVSALQKVGLNADLDAPVTEGGKNFSVGERQLLCLARVLTLDKPVILMDEPTSAVDMDTDGKIQAVLENHLGGKTVITIAHRLESLRRYDLIVELKAGRFHRQGPPQDVIPQIMAEGSWDNGKSR